MTMASRILGFSGKIRTRSITPVVFAVLTMICTGSIAVTPCGKDYMTYKYPGKNHFGYRFRDGKWWRINIGGGPDQAPSKNSMSPKPPLGRVEKIVSCSTSEYRCVQTYLWVFAVPKGKLMPTSSYKIAGADIQLGSCLKKTSTGCVTLFAISDCRSHGSGKSVPPGEAIANDCRASGRGQRVVFIFDQDRGVIAFEESDDWEPQADAGGWDLSSLGRSAAMLALAEQRGLLSCELPTITTPHLIRPHSGSSD